MINKKLLPDRQLAIFEGTAENVTEQEVSNLIRCLQRRDMTSDVDALRITYHNILQHTKRYEICERFNISPAEHMIIRYNWQYYIDGYPEKVFEFLFVRDSDNYHYSHSNSIKFRNVERYLMQNNMEAELLLLYSRYSVFLEGYKQHFIQVHAVSEKVNIDIPRR